MSDTLLSPADFASTVVAVPPIALTDTLDVSLEANRAVARHIEKGGVRILLYGGNANLYHFGLGHYAQALEMMKSVASPDTRIITSIGPDFGKAMDQAPLVERSGIRNVMLLPVAFPADSDGVGSGARRIAERLGHAVILYVKRDGYVQPATLRRLVEEGAVSFVKYAVEHPDPATDPYLDALVAEIGPDRIASGMGETPIVDHIGRRRLATFTSGAVCIAPAAAMRLLKLLKAGSFAEARSLAEPFLAFERVRSRLGGIQVLHEAVSAAIAPMGPLMPFLSNIKPAHEHEVSASLVLLTSEEREFSVSL